MDEQTTNVMSHSAAASVHFVPCSEHSYREAIQVGLNGEEIGEAAEIAGSVKNGADLALRRSISEIMGDCKETPSCCSGQADGSSCHEHGRGHSHR